MKLSVIILTYNHEKYIAQALESVLSQKTDFDFQIIVSDDNSTDNTIAIAQQIKEKSSVPINIIQNKENIGVEKNGREALAAVKGKYVALLDGDDFWTHPQKLQKQIDFLEQNPSYNGCFHDASIIHEKKAEKILFKNFEKYSEIYRYQEDIYPWDLTNRLILPTNSLVMKSDFIWDASLNYITDNYSVIWKVTCLAIKSSKFRYFKNQWSTYRNHTQGISKKNTLDFHLSHIHFLEKLLEDDYYQNLPFEIFQSIENEYNILFHKLKEKERTTSIQELKWKYYKIVWKKTRYFMQKLTN